MISIEWVRLDGPFAPGATGVTKPRGHEATTWTITEVTEGARAVIEHAVPGAVFRFHWRFEDLPSGRTRITQTAELEGEKAADYVAAVEVFKEGIPAGMAKLTATVNRAASGPPKLGHTGPLDSGR
jgi:hypothetical protein